MSKVMWLAFVIFPISSCQGSEDAEAAKREHAYQSQFEWSMHHVMDGQGFAMAGPHGRLRLMFADNNLRVSNTKGETTALSVIPPASFVWRPNGNGIAINNGNGSGQISKLILVISDGSLAASSVIGNQLEEHFNAKAKCEVSPSDISVTAVGWSLDSRSILVKFEDWSREVNCPSQGVDFAKVDLINDTVQDISEGSAMDQFCPEAAFRKLFGPNCLAYERLRMRGKVGHEKPDQ